MSSFAFPKISSTNRSSSRIFSFPSWSFFLFEWCFIVLLLWGSFCLSCSTGKVLPVGSYLTFLNLTPFGLELWAAAKMLLFHFSHGKFSRRELNWKRSAKVSFFSRFYVIRRLPNMFIFNFILTSVLCFQGFL